MISVITGEFTILIPRKYGWKICAISFWLWSSYLKVYIHLPCINTQRWTTTPIFFVIAIVTDEFAILILQNYSFKVCVIFFCFNSTRFKVYIHLPVINTQRQTTASFNITPLISSSEWQTTGLYQGSADCCDGDHISNIICLLQPSQAIHYCNQSGLAIVPDLKIFVFSIVIFYLIFKRALVWFSLLRVIYLYNSTGLCFFIFCL